MSGFTWVDGVVFAVLLLSGVLGNLRGMLRELLTIVVWIAAIIISYIFAPSLQPMVPSLPFIGPYLEGSCELSMLMASIVIFTISLAVLSLFTPLLSSLFKNTFMDGIDRALGLLFGLFRGLAIVIAALFIYSVVLPSQGVAAVDESASYGFLGSVIDNISERNPETLLNWVTNRYEGVIGVCKEGQSA